VKERNHSQKKNSECLCTFILSWLQGPNEGKLSAAGIGDICIVQPIREHVPAVASFLDISRRIIESKSRQELVAHCHKGTKTKTKMGFFERMEKVSSVCIFMFPKYFQLVFCWEFFINSIRFLDDFLCLNSYIPLQGKQRAKRSLLGSSSSEGLFLSFYVIIEVNFEIWFNALGFSSEIFYAFMIYMFYGSLRMISLVTLIGPSMFYCVVETMEDKELEGKRNVCMILIGNVDKELCPSTTVEFLYKHTQVSASIFIFPSLSFEINTRGVIMSHTEQDFQKLCDFLTDQNYIITSSTGR